MPRTAREAFLTLPACAEFKKMAETNSFDTACEYALLTMFEEIPEEADPNGGWTQYARTIGARRVLEILRTIHLKQEPPKPYRPPTLKPPS